MFTEYYLGKNIFDVVSFLSETGEEHIERVLDKTGPKYLNHCSVDEDSLSLAKGAMGKLIARDDFDPNQVEQLISVTESTKLRFPGNSFELASFSGILATAQLVDLNAGCTGFIDALSLAYKSRKKTLIICSETYSKRMGTNQRSVKCLFSDGATATYFDPAEFELVSEVSKYIPNSSLEISCTDDGYLTMNGPGVFTFGLTDVLPLITEALELNPAIKTLFVHQGSKVIVDAIKEKVQRYPVSVPSNIKLRGNTVSATIPLLIEDHCKTQFCNNDVFALVGFGVGLYIHGIVLKKK